MTSQHQTETSAKTAVRYEYTPAFPQILEHLNATLLISTYQAGKLLRIGVHDGKLTITFSHFDRAMGIAIDRERIALGTRRQIHFLRGSHDIAKQMPAEQGHDGCWSPRASFYTGNIHGHELMFGNEGLWVVNTLFSCLCMLHEDFSFVPRWKPKFIKELAGQDRCHLNGLALDHGQPRFATCMAQTNEPAGWRPTKATTGCVLDIESSEAVVTGLAMPHSPRWFHDKLWVLNSGCGTLNIVDHKAGKLQVVESMPGYTRGLALMGQFAFVGLSKIRETSVFGGMPIEAKKDELRCGVGIVDLHTGKTVAVFQFFTGVDEIFAVDLIPGMKNPYLQGPIDDRVADDDTEAKDVWIVPSPNQEPPKEHRLPIYARPFMETPHTINLKQNTSPEEMLQLSRQFIQQGQQQEGCKLLTQAIPLLQNPAVALVDLGNLQQEMDQQPEALVSYEQAIKADPTCIAARQNFAYLLFNQGFIEESLKQYQELVKLEDSPINHLLEAITLPIIYPDLAAITKWRTRMEDSLDAIIESGSYVDTLKQPAPTNFFVAYSGQKNLPVMQRIGKIVRGVDLTEKFPRKPHPQGKIRVGFLSAYMHRHTVGGLNIGRITKLNRKKYEVTCLYVGRSQDVLNQEYRRVADHFLQIPRSMEIAREQIASQGLDVLFFTDVGMDALTSSLAYSRMAKVQSLTWGHPETSGSPFMDYFLSGEFLDHEQATANYSEKLIRPPHLSTYYDRPARTGPALTKEFFGLPTNRHLYLCPQTLFKFHPEIDFIFKGIIEQDPLATIVLIAGRVDQWKQLFLQRIRKSIPHVDQHLCFLPSLPKDDFLGLFELADVVIDPIHFGGGNTSYEALAFGAPLITMPGDFLRSRITYALYQKMQYTKLVVNSPQDYIKLATGIACNPELRANYSREILERVPVIFNDIQEVHALEQYLESIV